MNKTDFNEVIKKADEILEYYYKNPDEENIPSPPHESHYTKINENLENSQIHQINTHLARKMIKVYSSYAIGSGQMSSLCFAPLLAWYSTVYYISCLSVRNNVVKAKNKFNFWLHIQRANTWSSIKSKIT